ncbi:MAG: hypothetical protein LC624_03320 [Halobacteriales archaeon]|nr:hypothetical protein [Halobacteriales archaeon]
MRPRLAALVLVALLASGCTVEPPQVQGQLPQPAGQRPGGNLTLVNGTLGNASLDAPPEWLHGQWWRYRAHSSDGSFDIRDTRVVTADLGSSWRGNRSVAGKPATVATMEARQGAKAVVRYTYAAEVGWFGTMQFLGPDGAPQFSLDLEAYGQGYKGNVVRVTAAPKYHDAGASLQPQGSFDVAQGASFLDLRLAFTGDQVGGSVNLLPPNNGQPVTINVGPCNANCSIQFGQQLNGTAGTWRIASLMVVQGQATAAHAQADVVAATVDRIAIA